MAKTLTIFLTTSPYSGENTYTAVKMAESALGKGHSVNLIASGDGVYAFLKKQNAKGLPHAGDLFQELMEKGLKVYL
jgi:sulfur relay (sulfurtransferase) complex TusBCD TusD component (DsrE family)